MNKTLSDKNIALSNFYADRDNRRYLKQKKRKKLCKQIKILLAMAGIIAIYGGFGCFENNTQDLGQAVVTILFGCSLVIAVRMLWRLEDE